MKYILSSLLIAFLISSCVDDSTGPSDSEKGTNPPVSSSQNCYNELDSVEKKVFDILSHDFWVVTGFHKINDKEASKTNKGRWYQLRPDCTFTVGHFDKELSTGTWNLEQTGTHIRLNAEDVSEDGLWRMQIKADGSMLVFVGTEAYSTTGVQQRIENLLFAPKSPKEMGWHE